MFLMLRLNILTRLLGDHMIKQYHSGPFLVVVVATVAVATSSVSSSQPAVVVNTKGDTQYDIHTL